MVKTKNCKQYLLKGQDGVLYLIPKDVAEECQVSPDDLPKLLKKISAKESKETDFPRGKVVMTDISGVFYSVPLKTAKQHQVPAESLPQILSSLTKEMPKVNWKEHLAGKEPGETKVPPLVVQAGLSAALSVGTAEALSAAHNCCIKDCCVIDCCIGDCSHSPCTSFCPKDCDVANPGGCHPVQ